MVYDQKFYNELSMCLTPHKYNEFEHLVKNKQAYLDQLITHRHNMKMLPHLQMHDFMYVLVQLNEEQILTLFIRLCDFGYYDKIRCMCYYVDFIDVDDTFIKTVVSYIIPHNNVFLIDFVVHHFNCGYVIHINTIIDKIIKYDVKCLDIFQNNLIIDPSRITAYIMKTLCAKRFELFAFLFDLFIEMNVYDVPDLIRITDQSVRNDIRFLEYINQNYPLRQYYDGHQVLYDLNIHNCQSLNYLCDHVQKRDVFQRKLFYKAIKLDKYSLVENINL